ncbi:MAG TPA: hypothetical protein EYG51_15355, partial [Pseudomonadales bacterium]|nr:hypothetical protein [Pseudomonadales bacterium]
MEQKKASVDQLYLIAESLSQDFSLFPQREPAAVIKGLISEQQIEIEVDRLHSLDIDSYIATSVTPSEETSRPGSKEIVESLDLPIIKETQQGPFYAAEVEMMFDGVPRRVGFITQDRAFGLGVWGPEHHELAAKAANDYAVRSMPIVCLMDTPGAD